MADLSGKEAVGRLLKGETQGFRGAVDL